MFIFEQELDSKQSRTDIKNYAEFYQNEGTIPDFRIAVKQNPFVHFLEEASAGKNNFDFV